jgi:hypothetical protein
VKLATLFLASAVALLLLPPIPAAAAPLKTVQQAGQTDDVPATPTSVVEEASPIVDFHATAGRLRGRVELGWSLATPASSGGTVDSTGVAGGVFIVERSTNGSSWRPVKVCYLANDDESEAYSCTDSRLASGTTYAYRVCLTGKPTTCSNALTTEPVSVKAP